MAIPQPMPETFVIEMTSTQLIDDYTIAGERYVVVWDPERKIKLTFKTRPGDQTELRDEVNLVCDGGVCAFHSGAGGEVQQMTGLIPLPRTVELLNGT